MGRIEEAMRRSGKATGGAAVRDPQVFASAWTLPEPDIEERVPEEPVRVAVPPGRLVRKADARPRPSLLDELDEQWRERLVTSPTVEPAFVEQFRRLAATMVHAQNVNRTKVVMVSSALPGDGKTLTTLNLGMVLSESYRRRVLLIDADLRRPSLSRAVKQNGTPGLSEVLKGSDERKAVVVQLTDSLTLLAAGAPDPDPLGGLTSSRMQRLLRDAAEGFDWVILDGPPVEAVADGGLLAAMVDAVLLVVRAGQTNCGSVQRSIDALGRDKILGVVLNGTDHFEQQQYSGYYASQPA